MCFSKKFFNNYWKAIKEEKNIRIRERREEQVRWITDLIFTIVLGGAIVFFFQLSSENKYNWLMIFIAIISIVCLAIGSFLAIKFLPDYCTVTNEYLTKKKVSKK